MADHFPDFHKKVDYISLDSVCLNKRVFYHPKDGIARNNGYDPADWAIRISDVMDVPAADVVPWEWLERYADYFCAGVSMPEFVREAKMFYASTNEAMQGGVIDG